MPKGKRTIDPANISDVDLLTYLPMLVALSLPDTTIEDDASVLQLTSVSFARIAECAVEQHAISLRQGKVIEFRKRARTLIESALAEHCYLAGRWHELHRLVGEGLISDIQFQELMATLKPKEEEIWRKAASHAAIILGEIQSRLTRIGRKGRPNAVGSADAFLRLRDEGILKDAADVAATKDRAAIRAEIPGVVRNYLHLGQLPIRGETEQEAVDRHTRRICRHMANLIASSTGGGFSVKRTLKS